MSGPPEEHMSQTDIDQGAVALTKTIDRGQQDLTHVGMRSMAKVGSVRQTVAHLESPLTHTASPTF